MRGGRVGGMKVAGDDADGDLPLAFGEGITAGVEVAAERARDFGQFWIVHPDLAGPGKAAAGLHHGVVAVLLLWRHLVIGDFGVTAEGWRVGHCWFPSQVGLAAHPATAAWRCRPGARSAIGV